MQLAVKQGLTLTDLSYDCIAELFARDEGGKFHNVDGFVASLRCSFDELPDLELFLAFKGFVVRLTDTQLARLYAQADPAGAKIHRNIKDCLKQSSDFLLQKDFRGYVLRPAAGETLDQVEPFPEEELDRRFQAVAKGAMLIPQLLKVLHSVLTEQQTYRRSLSLVDVVKLFKKLLKDDTAFTEETNPALDGLTAHEIAEMRQQVEVALKEKILLTYLARGKVDRQQAEALFNAFRDMMGDWCSGADSEFGLREYLVRYIPVDEDTYENGFRVKMEYLLKIARNEFAARLMKEL